jgi:hypothetical protein
MQPDDAMARSAEDLARYRWFLSRLHWIERQVDARPIPPGHRARLSNDLALRLYQHLKAEYQPQQQSDARP